jgi:16S rRNA (guanine966-N2)-methyltransferase
VLVGDSFALARCGAVVGGPFALLLLDPPYRLDASESVRLVHNIAARELLEPEAVVVFEHAAGVVVGWPDGVRLIGRKRYGSTEIDIAVYERGAGPT